MKRRAFSLLTALALCVGLFPVTAAAAEPASQSAPALTFGQTISAGDMHMTVIKEDGTVWSWGYTEGGRLGVAEGAWTFTGDPDCLPQVYWRSEPVQVPLDKPAVSVSGYTSHTAVITAGGELWNWGGHNAYGGLGREVEGSFIAPGKVMDHAQEAAIGNLHTAVLADDGTLWTFGGNIYGQIGNGGKGELFEGKRVSYNYQRLPLPVLDNVKAVSAGSNNTYAIRTDDSLWAWGKNDGGILGNDDSVFLEGQHDDSLLGEVYFITYQNGEDGWSYFMEPSGGLGGVKFSGESRQEKCCAQMTPVKIMDGVRQVASDSTTTAILKTDGTLWSTSINRRYLEYVSGEGSYYTYAPNLELDDVVDMDIGGRTFAAIRSDGSLWTWGDNLYGQQGRGELTYAEEDIPGKALEDVVDVSVGYCYIAALKSDGSLWMAGANGLGQLGGATDAPQSDVFIKVMDGVALPASYTQARLTPQIHQADQALIQTVSLREDKGEWDATPWNQRAMQIPDFATYFNGNAYAFLSWPDCTWDQAENYCLSVGGHLATVTTREEQEFVGWVGDPHWIGARRNQYGGWSWVTGESWNYNAWHPGENDNYMGCEDVSAVWGGGWLDVSNDQGGMIGFICEWETAGRRLPTPPAPIYSVTFCIQNNVRLDTFRKQVVQGQSYGWLPTPTLEGWRFVGWFTQEDGGRMITSSTQVNQSGSIFLYAKWNKISGGPTVPALSYSFGNNSYDFNYGEGYRIPYDRYTAVFGDNSYARAVYDADGLWGGNCSGMVTSALMLYMKAVSGLTVSGFRSGAVSPAELQLGDVNTSLGWNLRDFIEVMQVAQYSPLCRGSQPNDYCGMVQAVQNFDFNGTAPVIISVKGPRAADGSRPGHALVGLGVWRKDETTDCITVYDPNWPGSETRYIELYRDSQGRYCAWRYDLSDRGDPVWGTAYDNAPIFFGFMDCFYEVWNNRGTSYVCSGQTMTVNSANASIYDYAGNLVATIRDGEVESLRADVTPVPGPMEGSAAGSNGVALWVPQEYFSVVNEDEGVETLSVTVTGIDSTVRVSTSSGRALVYAGDENGVAIVSGDGAHYEMVLTNGEGEAHLTGTALADTPACLARIDGQLRSTGVQLSEGSALTINGQAGTADDLQRTTLLDVVTSTGTGSISAVFADVSGESYYAPAVQWAYDNAITNGTGMGLFSPTQALTRAEAVTLLWRAAGCPVSTAEVAPFEDIGEGDYFYQAALWAVGAGITTGTGAARFSPCQTCSNWEYLTLLWRLLGTPGQGNELAGYEDGGAWAAGQGLLKATGLSDDLSTPCLRQDALVFLYRALS